MDQDKNYLVVIKGLHPTLHRVEKKIAKFILEQPEVVIYMSIAKMAKQLDVAESSIVRFCKIIGVGGFKELKINLAKNMDEPERLIFEDIDKEDDSYTIAKKVFSTSISALSESLGTIDADQFEQAVSGILTAKRIEFYGVGSSSTVAQDAYFRLMRIGFPAYACVDSHMGRLSAATMGPDCLAIGISYSGRTNDTVEILNIAKDRNAKTMCITCFPLSPITKVADIQLIMSTREAKLMREAISSRIALFALIDSLYAAVAVRRYETVVEYIENISDITSKLRLT